MGGDVTVDGAVLHVRERAGDEQVPGMDHVRPLEDGDRVAIGMGTGGMDQSNPFTVEAQGHFIVVDHLRSVTRLPRRSPIARLLEILPDVAVAGDDRALIEERSVGAGVVGMRMRVDDHSDPRIPKGRQGRNLLAQHLGMPGIHH